MKKFSSCAILHFSFLLKDEYNTEILIILTMFLNL
jgi:hypothetical protein